MEDAVSAIERFLVRYSGVPFCPECLAHELAIPLPAAAAALAGCRPPDFLTEQRWCARCFRQRRTVRSVPGAGAP
jgi:hypothetical protein